jgi:hypothetical protein
MGLIIFGADMFYWITREEVDKNIFFGAMLLSIALLFASDKLINGIGGFIGYIGKKGEKEVDEFGGNDGSDRPRYRKRNRNEDEDDDDERFPEN